MLWETLASVNEYIHAVGGSCETLYLIDTSAVHVCELVRQPHITDPPLHGVLTGLVSTIPFPALLTAATMHVTSWYGVGHPHTLAVRAEADSVFRQLFSPHLYR